MSNKPELNTDNPEYFTWQYEQLYIAILGGLKIERMDRMRVTLKIQWKEQAIRHNLDLYNDTAQRLRLPTTWAVMAVPAA